MIRVTNYKFYKQIIKNNIKICIISDIHFSKNVKDEKLNNLINALTEIAPKYILIPGDTINSINSLDEKEEKERLYLFLKKLGSIAPTFICLGNHDVGYKYYDTKSKIQTKYKYPKNIIDEINKIKNIYLMDNASYENNEIFITGHTQFKDYYHYDHAKTSIFHPIKENKENMINSLKKLNEKTTLPKNKIKILLTHSPIYLKDENVINIIDDYDYFVSGHMHNGCVIPLLDKIWHSDKGIIAPSRELFPSNARCNIKYQTDKLIISGPITTFNNYQKILNKFNILFPSHITVLEFTNDKKYNKKYINKKEYRVK